MPAHPELLLISAVVRTRDHKTLLAEGLSPVSFHVYNEEAKWLFGYIERHRKTPSREAIKSQWPSIRIYRVDDVAHYCSEVKKENVRTGIMDVLDQAILTLDMDDPDKALRVIQQGIHGVQVRAANVAADYDAFEDWEATYRVVEDRVNRVATTGFAGVPSGFGTLDHITGGWHPGWFGVVAARMGTGKTWTGIRMGFAASATNHKVLFYSLEQNRHQVAMRLHSFASRVHAQHVFNSLDLNRGYGFDLRKYRRFLERLKEKMGTGHFYINDSSRGTVTPLSISAGIETTGPDIVFIDYLTLMGTNDDSWRGTARLSGELQALGQRYNVPIVAMSQVNRLGIGKEPPSADHLSQADAIGHDADVVVTMAKQSSHVMKLLLAKNRHGPNGVKWFCKFSPGTGQYDEINGDEAAEQIELDNEVD